MHDPNGSQPGGTGAFQLCGNAIKFTHEGSIRIGYEARDTELYFYVKIPEPEFRQKNYGCLRALCETEQR
jgi:hypothetical protein